MIFAKDWQTYYEKSNKKQTPRYNETIEFCKKLDEASQLKKDFKSKLETDSTFANKPRERLNYFYKNSPYWDKKINKYPVGKLNF